MTLRLAPLRSAQVFDGSKTDVLEVVVLKHRLAGLVVIAMVLMCKALIHVRIHCWEVLPTCVHSQRNDTRPGRSRDSSRRLLGPTLHLQHGTAGMKSKHESCATMCGGIGKGSVQNLTIAGRHVTSINKHRDRVGQPVRAVCFSVSILMRYLPIQSNATKIFLTLL